MNWDEKTSYAVHNDESIKGFFGDYRWLSNYHVSPVELEGRCYDSVEVAYQSSKCAKFSDRDKFNGLSPSESKKLGKRILIRPDWEQVKREIMYRCVLSKFSLTEDLKTKLLATGTKYLEETNHWKDVVWGVDFKTGLGENCLGKILMQVRKELGF